MALHRFVQIGDLHLGPKPRNEDRRAALDQIIAENIHQPVAAWLWPGDLDDGRMTIEDKNFLTARVQRMADHAPVVISYGNHDLPGDLDFLAQLHAVWPIFVVSRSQTLRVPLATGATAAIFCLAYPTRAAMVAAGTPSDQIVETARRYLDTLFIAAAQALKEGTEEGCIPLMIGHVNVGGSIMSTGQPNIGKEIELDPVLIQRLGPIYVGLNHIHKAQEIGGATYAGSCCRLDWGEIDPKSYIVVTYQQVVNEIEQWQDWSWRAERKPIDVAPMYHVEGELTREGFTPSNGEAVATTNFAGAEVRVRYRFNANEKSALDEALVRAPFEGAKRIETDPIALRERAARAPEVAAAQTLEDKVAAFVRRSGIEWSPGLEQKLSALQQPDGAAFLSEVQKELSGPRQPAEAGKSDDRSEPVSSAGGRAGSDSTLAGVAR